MGQASDESEKAYSAFKFYLETENRSLQKVSEMLSKSRQLLTRWSNKYHWKERVAAWDSSILEGVRKLKADKLKKRIERREKIGLMLQMRAAQALQEKDLSKTGVKSLVEMLCAGRDFEDSAAELENIQENVTDSDDVTIIELPEKEKKI